MTTGDEEKIYNEDFNLARSAMDGVTSAVEELQQLLAEQFQALTHFRLAESELADIRTAMFSSLIVNEIHANKRLQRYSGTGPLAGWLRVAATREVLMWLRKNRREVRSDDEALLGSLEAPSESPELELLKKRYQGAFSTSFRRAIAGLETRQRNLLRQHYLDELTLEEVAAMYRVHRSTAARWLTEARDRLLELTREDIAKSLGLPIHEIDSLMRLLQSRLDLSASIFLSSVRPG